MALALGVLLTLAHSAGAVKPGEDAPRAALDQTATAYTNNVPTLGGESLFEWDLTPAPEPTADAVGNGSGIRMEPAPGIQTPPPDDVIRTIVIGSADGPPPFWESNNTPAGARAGAVSAGAAWAGKTVSTDLEVNPPDARSVTPSGIPAELIAICLTWGPALLLVIAGFVFVRRQWRRRPVWMLTLD